MTILADIETTTVHDDLPPEEQWRDWFVIETTPHGVHFRHDYLQPGETERGSWCDQGSGFALKHLDEVVAALLKLQADLKSDDKVSPM